MFLPAVCNAKGRGRLTLPNSLRCGDFPEPNLACSAGLQGNEGRFHLLDLYRHPEGY